MISRNRSKYQIALIDDDTVDSGLATAPQSANDITSDPLWIVADQEPKHEQESKDTQAVFIQISRGDGQAVMTRDLACDERHVVEAIRSYFEQLWRGDALWKGHRIETRPDEVIKWLRGVLIPEIGKNTGANLPN